ncbi:phytoene desaturase family protein [Saccharopolyspora hattusasensis]|uniref:phytoene desaturase family protein n=1 Tax=Saccharopolyspora hattusasensis TaxID=1128679 RepID=UPI003D98107A
MTARRVVIVGGGHNGLVCAAYLAKRGASVTVVEARKRLGGPAASFEYMHGYHAAITNSPGSLEYAVVQELELERHGLTYCKPEITLVQPFDDMVFLGWRDRSQVDTQLEHFSRGESRRYRELTDTLNSVGAKTGLSLWKPSLPLKQIRENLGDSAERRLFDELVDGSLKEILDSRLKSDQAKSILTMLAVNAQLVSPTQPGSGVGLLMRPISMASSEDAGPDSANKQVLRGSVGLPIGSMSAIVDAMVRAGEEAGVTFITGVPVTRIVVNDGRAVGVKLDDTTTLEADVVVSTVEPSVLYTELLDNGPANLAGSTINPPTGSAFKLAVALDGLPSVRNLPPDVVPERAFRSQFRIGPSTSYIEKAIQDGLEDLPSDSPIMWGLIPSLTSPGLAPEGRHLMSVNVWHAPHSLGRDYWTDGGRDAFGHRCLAVLDEHLPGLNEHIVDYRFLGPIELADELRLPGSNITHGNMLPDRLFGNRPNATIASTGSGVRGLFLGGSGVWPGGYVTGAPGRNAANYVCQYLEKC